MKGQRYSIALLAVWTFASMAAQRFEDVFDDRTLRVDYIFSGDHSHSQISLDEMYASTGWYGRRVNMKQLLLQGNGQLTMTDTLGRMHSDAQFAGSSSVPAHVEMMGFLGIGNNPMVGCSVACAVNVDLALNHK